MRNGHFHLWFQKEKKKRFVAAITPYELQPNPDDIQQEVDVEQLWAN